MGTGYYVDKAHAEQTKKLTIEYLANFMAEEMRNGFDGYEGEYFPGVVGEMGCSWVRALNFY